MPTYEIEQYELHVMRYRIEAAGEAEAVAGLLAGEAEPVCESQDYVEVAEDYGLPADEHPGLADGLRDLGVPVNSVIPSIRSVQEVCPAEADDTPADEDDDSRLWRNFYLCPDCDVEWEDVWDCQCNDRCPSCNKEIQPYKSE